MEPQASYRSASEAGSFSLALSKKHLAVAYGAVL